MNVYAVVRVAVGMSLTVLCSPAMAQSKAKAIDPVVLAKATERGVAMFKAPLWRAGRASILGQTDAVLIVRQGTPAAIEAVDMANGKTLWETRYREGSPTISDGPEAQMAFVTRTREPGIGPGVARAFNGELEVVNLADRGTAWTVPYTTVLPLPTFAGDMLVTGARVNFQPMNGRLIPPTDVAMEVRAYDRKTGKPAWSWSIPQPSTGTAPYRSNVNTPASPAYGDGKVYFVLDQTPARNARDVTSTATNVLSMVALNVDDGKVAWTKPVNTTDISAVAYGEGLVLTTIEAGELVARDSKTGEIRWHTFISPDADPAVSKFTKLVNRNEGMSALRVDDDLVLVHAVGQTEPPTETGQVLTNGAARGTVRSENRSAGMAAFDLRTGKQRWFFPLMMPARSFGAPGPNPIVMNYFARVAVGPNQIVLSASGDMPGGAYGYMGINRRSGELEWYVHPTNPGMVAMRGDVAFITMTAGSSEFAEGLYAVSVAGNSGQK